MKILFGQHNRRADFAQGFDQIANALNHDRSKSLAGLIKQKYAGIAHQRPPNRQHLLLATRELSTQTILQRLEQGKHVIDPLQWPVILSLWSFFDGNHQVVLDCQVGKYLSILGYKSNPLFGDDMGCLPADIGTIKLNAAASNRNHARDRFHGRALTSPIAAKQGQCFTLVDLE